MTPEEKAKELIDGCFEIIGSSYSGYMITACHLAILSAKTAKEECISITRTTYWYSVLSELEKIKKNLEQ